MAEYDMIENPDSKDTPRMNKPAGTFVVLSAWSWISGWMVVEKDQGGSAVPYCGSKYFPWVYN